MTKSAVERLRSATGPDRELNAALHAMRGLQVRYQVREDGQGSWRIYEGQRKDGTWADLPNYTGSIDDALLLVPEDVPGKRRHSACVWAGYRPAARILYDERDDNAEGGWAIGALNPWEVKAPTPALAVCLACAEAAGVIKLWPS